jgi:hypothetical protein
MTAFLILIGMIALLLFSKLIYDSLLKSRTEVGSNQDHQSNREIIVRHEENEKHDLQSNGRPQDKRESLIRMAKNLGCLPSNVKEEYITRLKELQLAAAQIKESLKMLDKRKHEEAKTFNIDPEDTVSAYMMEWTKEFLENKEYEYRPRTVQEVVEDFLTENPEFEKVAKSQDMSGLQDFTRNNSDSVYALMENIELSDRPAEKYRRKAIDRMYKEKDYIGAIQLINKGLEFDEPQTEPFLYNLRANCHQKTLKPS